MKFSEEKKDKFYGNWMIFDLAIWAVLYYGLVCAVYVIRMAQVLARIAREKLRSRRRDSSSAGS
jgi:hypothetical protein